MNFQPYLLITVFTALDTNGLSNGLSIRVCMVLKLIFHTGAELNVSREIDASWESLSGRSKACLSVGLAIDVFTSDSWNVAGIA